jgi:hypothetical protein
LPKRNSTARRQAVGWARTPGSGLPAPGARGHEKELKEYDLDESAMHQRHEWSQSSN